MLFAWVLKMKHIVQFSGGKDSTAMLLMLLEKNIKIDEIIFCDTGKEFPAMYRHIEKVRNYISRYNKDITILKPDKTFDYYMFDHVKTKGKNKGSRGYGWANMGIRWCTTILKKNITNKYLKKQNYISYIGIAYDEPKRHRNIEKNVEHPLYDWKITEKQALEYCYSKGFNWEGLYEDFKRVSCWCCPLKSLSELRVLYNKYPNLWEKLKQMDNKSSNSYRIDYSLQELEEIFKKENSQINLFEVN